MVFIRALGRTKTSSPDGHKFLKDFFQWQVSYSSASLVFGNEYVSINSVD